MTKNILAENMRRFGTKNLNEDFDQNNNGYPDDVENGNDNGQPNQTQLEQTHVNALLDYVLHRVDEDDYDMLESKIGRALKNYNWTFASITHDKMPAIKEILFKYFTKSKYNLLDPKFLKNTAKKNQPVINGMKWLIEK
jgi:hypothetical protein